MNTSNIFNTSSNIPLHHQLYCHIRDCINSGEYLPHDKLKSESEMQKEYGVSRITVRRAITDLAYDGLVRKIHGKGTIVLPRKNQRDITNLSSFSSDAKTKGARPGSIILKFDIVSANVKISTALKISLDEQVYFLKRLRTINGEILSLQNTYITSRKDLQFKREDFTENSSLYEMLEVRGIQLDCADETIETFPPPQDIRTQLFLEENQWVFYKERTTYDIQGFPIEFSENYYIADKYRYFIHITKIK